MIRKLHIHTLLEIYQLQLTHYLGGELYVPGNTPTVKKLCQAVTYVHFITLPALKNEMREMCVQMKIVY
jgi:hypothetical protein